MIHVYQGELRPMQVKPSDYGIDEAPLSAIKGDSPAFNVQAIQKVFSGKGEQAHTHAIAMNAASLIWLHELDKPSPQNLKTCFEQAMDAISEAKPFETIQLTASISQG
jgi:anthranilate phosphoribosyltransferase